MVDTENSTTTDKSDVSYSLQDLNVESCIITPYNGDSYDLKQLMVELSYYEDIFSFCASGYITVRDAVGLIEAFELSGKESIEIKFGKFRDDTFNLPPQKFIVYKVSNRHPLGNMNSEFYTLYFCSQELLTSEQVKVSKAYTGYNISKIVTDILTNNLKSPDKIYDVENTVGTYDFVIPTLKPFEAISWLSTYARPEGSGTTGLVGADMLLFETKQGYRFASLNTLKNQDSYATYRYQQNNLNTTNEAFDDESVSVLSFEIIKAFDTLNSVSSGAFSNRTIVIDPLTKTYEVKNFDYNTYVSDITPVNSSGILPDITNKDGKSVNENYEGKLSVAWGNPHETDVPYIKDRPGSVAKDVFVQDYIRYRTAQLSLANHTVVKLVVPGDYGLVAGATIDFNMFSLSNGENRELDKFYSGKYLITAVRHIAQSQGVYQTVLEIAKDSVLQDYQSMSTSN